MNSNATTYGDNDNDKDGFDNFLGGDFGIFASSSTTEYTDEDKEADEIWDSIDTIMQSRCKERNAARVKEDIENFRKSNPKITEQFAGLKKKLNQLTKQDWESIPDIGDYSFKNKNKKRRFQSFVPVPDFALDHRNKDVHQIQTPVTYLVAVGEGRGTVLSLKLDKISDSVSGLTVVDPEGYLTDLKSMKISSDSEISDN